MRKRYLFLQQWHIKIISCVLILFLSVDLVWGRANPLPQQAAPPQVLNLTPSVNPSLLKGIKFDPEHQLRLEFMADRGNQQQSEEQFQHDLKRFMKYLLASLTIPEDQWWVNLSPYEQDRVVNPHFGETELGRDLLHQDYLLKQLTASLLHPDNVHGQQFWQHIYQEAFERYGTTEIPINTFHKVWIVPDVVDVYENKQNENQNTTEHVAYVIDAKLKVMLEQDYLAASHQPMDTGLEVDQNELSTEVMRLIIIPAIEQEVNHGHLFVELRQIYHALILGQWLKKKLFDMSLSVVDDHQQENIHHQLAADNFLKHIYVNQNKTSGISHDRDEAIQQIYQQYVNLFRQGLYNLVREEAEPETEETIARQYLSGGADFAMLVQLNIQHELSEDAERALERARGLYRGEVVLLDEEVGDDPEAVQAVEQTLQAARDQTMNDDELSAWAKLSEELALNIGDAVTQGNLFAEFNRWANDVGESAEERLKRQNTLLEFQRALSNDTSTETLSKPLESFDIAPKNNPLAFDENKDGILNSTHEMRKGVRKLAKSRDKQRPGMREVLLRALDKIEKYNAFKVYVTADARFVGKVEVSDHIIRIHQALLNHPLLDQYVMQALLQHFLSQDAFLSEQNIDPNVLIQGLSFETRKELSFFLQRLSVTVSLADFMDELIAWVDGLSVSEQMVITTHLKTMFAYKNQISQFRHVYSWEDWKRVYDRFLNKALIYQILKDQFYGLGYGVFDLTINTFNQELMNKRSAIRKLMLKFFKNFTFMPALKQNIRAKEIVERLSSGMAPLAEQLRTPESIQQLLRGRDFSTEEDLGVLFLSLYIFGGQELAGNADRTIGSYGFSFHERLLQYSLGRIGESEIVERLLDSYRKRMGIPEERHDLFNDTFGEPIRLIVNQYKQHTLAMYERSPVASDEVKKQGQPSRWERFWDSDWVRFFKSPVWWIMIPSFIGGPTLAVLGGLVAQFVIKPLHEMLLFRAKDHRIREATGIQHESFNLLVDQLTVDANLDEIANAFYQLVSTGSMEEMHNTRFRIYVLSNVLNRVKGHSALRLFLEEFQQQEDLTWENLFQVYEQVYENHKDNLSYEDVLFLRAVLMISNEGSGVFIFRLLKRLSVRILTSPLYIVETFMKSFGFDHLSQKPFQLRNKILMRLDLAPNVSQPIRFAQDKTVSSQSLSGSEQDRQRAQHLFGFIRDTGTEGAEAFIDGIDQDYTIRFQKFTDRKWFPFGAKPKKNVNRSDNYRIDVRNKVIYLSQDAPDFMNALALVKLGSYAFEHSVVRGLKLSFHIPSEDAATFRSNFYKNVVTSFLSKSFRHKQGIFFLASMAHLLWLAPRYFLDYVYSSPSNQSVLRSEKRPIFTKLAHDIKVTLFQSFFSKSLMPTNQPVFEPGFEVKKGIGYYIKKSIQPLIPWFKLFGKMIGPITIFSMVFGVFIFHFNLDFLVDLINGLVVILGSIPIVGDVIELLWEMMKSTYHNIRALFDRLLKISFDISLEDIQDFLQKVWEKLLPVKDFIVDYVNPFIYKVLIPMILYLVGLVYGGMVHLTSPVYSLKKLVQGMAQVASSQMPLWIGAFIFSLLIFMPPILLTSSFLNGLLWLFGSLIVGSFIWIGLISNKFYSMFDETGEIQRKIDALADGISQKSYFVLEKFSLLVKPAVIIWTIVTTIQYLITLALLSFPPLNLQFVMESVHRLGIPFPPILFVLAAVGLTIGFPYAVIYKIASMMNFPDTWKGEHWRKMSLGALFGAVFAGAVVAPTAISSLIKHNPSQAQWIHHQKVGAVVDIEFWSQREAASWKEVQRTDGSLSDCLGGHCTSIEEAIRFRMYSMLTQQVEARVVLDPALIELMYQLVPRDRLSAVGVSLVDSMYSLTSQTGSSEQNGNNPLSISKALRLAVNDLGERISLEFRGRIARRLHDDRFEGHPDIDPNTGYVSLDPEEVFDPLSQYVDPVINGINNKEPAFYGNTGLLYLMIYKTLDFPIVVPEKYPNRFWNVAIPHLMDVMKGDVHKGLNYRERFFHQYQAFAVLQAYFFGNNDQLSMRTTATGARYISSTEENDFILNFKHNGAEWREHLEQFFALSQHAEEEYFRYKIDIREQYHRPMLNGDQSDIGSPSLDDWNGMIDPLTALKTEKFSYRKFGDLLEKRMYSIRSIVAFDYKQFFDARTIDDFYAKLISLWQQERGVALSYDDVKKLYVRQADVFRQWLRTREGVIKILGTNKMFIDDLLNAEQTIIEEDFFKYIGVALSIDSISIDDRRSVLVAVMGSEEFQRLQQSREFDSILLFSEYVRFSSDQPKENVLLDLYDVEELKLWIDYFVFLDKLGEKPREIMAGLLYDTGFSIESRRRIWINFWMPSELSAAKKYFGIYIHPDLVRSSDDQAKQDQIWDLTLSGEREEFIQRLIMSSWTKQILQYIKENNAAIFDIIIQDETLKKVYEAPDADTDANVDADGAMVALPYGGIDLNPVHWLPADAAMTVDKEGMTDDQIQHIKTNMRGLAPVVVNVQPMTNWRGWMAY